MTNESDIIKQGRIYDAGVEVRYEVTSHRLDFTAHQGIEQEDGSMWYSTDIEDGTAEFEKATRFIEGFIKWDGCSHCWFGDDEGYLHLCGAKDLASVGWVLHEMFRIASAEMPYFDSSIAEGWPAINA